MNDISRFLLISLLFYIHYYSNKKLDQTRLLQTKKDNETGQIWLQSQGG